MVKLIIFILISCNSYASTTISPIAGIDFSSDESKPNLVFIMKNGLVGKLPFHDLKTLFLLNEGTKNHKVFEINMDQDRLITGVRAMGETPPIQNNEIAFPVDRFTPSVLPDMQVATAVFDELNPKWRRRAECFNKAHVWVYEENQKRKLNLMKVFLFFTSKYIWDYNWNWWFHVSPYVMVSENNNITENVIDYTFMKGPTKMHDWTNYFIIPHTECPTVEKYSDYDQHQQESYCYLIKKSMYYWQPQDIENLEKTGAEKNSFLMDEVSAAYWQAF